MSSMTNANNPKTAEGRQYHLGVAPGEISKYILLCGDPARAERTANFFSEVNYKKRHREFITITGKYNDLELTVMATGIGPDNTEIAVIESAQCVENPVYIRVGSCGALQDHTEIGSLIITNEVIRRDGVSDLYLPRGTKVSADEDVKKALMQSVDEKNYLPYLVGTTCSAFSFYAGQGREIEGFPIRDKKIFERLKKRGVLNFEMETATLLALAAISTRGIKAGSICAVYANRSKNEFISEEEMPKAEERCIKAGLRALEILAEKEKSN